MIIVQFLVLIVLVVFVVWGVFYLWEGRGYQNTDERVVYMGSNLGEQAEIVKQVIEKYIGVDVTHGYSLIEPGAGLATMSSYLAKEFSWKQVMAVELRKSIYWLGKCRLFLLNNRSVRYILGDIFKVSYPKPAVFYCYLTTPIITKLWKQGALKNSLVICLTFEIEGVRPIETISLQSWQGAIRVYDFRG